MYRSILIPLALDHEHTPREALAVSRRLLADGGRIAAVHAMEPFPAYVAQYLPDMDEDRRRAEARVAMRMALEDDSVEVEAIRGSAGRAICDHAAEIGADLIVVASHRPGLQDVFLGSTAARVVRHAACAVHVLR